MGRSLAPVNILRRRSIEAPTESCVTPAIDDIVLLASPTRSSTRSFNTKYPQNGSPEKKTSPSMSPTESVEDNPTKVSRSVSDACVSQTTTEDEKKGFIARCRQTSVGTQPVEPIARCKSAGNTQDPPVMEIFSLAGEVNLGPMETPKGTRSIKTMLPRRRRSAGSATDRQDPPMMQVSSILTGDANGVDSLASPGGNSTRSFKTRFTPRRRRSVGASNESHDHPTAQDASDGPTSSTNVTGASSRSFKAIIPPIPRRRSVGAPTDGQHSNSTEDGLDPIGSRSFKTRFTPIRRRSVGASNDNHDQSTAQDASDGPASSTNVTGASSRSFKAMIPPIPRRRSVGAPTDGQHSNSTEDGLDPIGSRSFKSRFPPIRRRKSVGASTDSQAPPVNDDLDPLASPADVSTTDPGAQLSPQRQNDEMCEAVEEKKGFFTRHRQQSLEKMPPTFLRISSAPMNAGSRMVSTMSKLKRAVTAPNGKDTQEIGVDSGARESGGEEIARESLVQLIVVPDRPSVSRLPLMASDVTDY